MINFFRKFTERAAALTLKKPPVVIALVGLIALAGALGSLKLNPDTGVESITGSTSPTYKATQEWSKTFGGDPIVVLVQGDLPKMMLSSDLGVLAGLEGCLSGNIPTSAQTQTDIPQICRQIGKFKPAVAVYGPGTFVNTAALSVTDGIKQVQARAKFRGEEAGKAAAEIARRQGQPELAQKQASDAAKQVAQLEALRDSLQLGQEYGLSLTNPPSLTNQAFVAQLVFDPAKGSDVPKSRFSYLFPNKKSAVIQVRLRPDMTPAQRAEAVDLVKRATANSKYQLQNGKYLVTGAPVVLTGIQESIQKAIVTLLIAALIVMGLALMLVFPAELRLLPLALALMAAAMTYGLLALTGSSIGVGAVAVLPVLVGLAVDYAIQFHARADQAMRDGADPPAAVMEAASSGGPPVLAAATATIAALLALALSPVPLVRGFGLLLVIGVALAITVVLTAGFATLGWAGGAAREKPRRKPAETVAGWLRMRTLFNHVISRPARVLAIASVLALFGWAAGLLSPVTTDIRQLVPNSLPAVRDAETLQKATGATGVVDVLVKAKDVTDPKVIAWMQKFQAQVLADAGYKGESPSCAKADLCPALSLADLFRGQELTKPRIRQLLASVGDFSRGVVSPGKRQATIAFGLRKESLNDQKKTIDRMRDRFNPPAGVTAQVVGLNALAADASGSLSNPLRRLLIAATALLLLFLVILAVTRKWRRAAAPVLSVAIAAGISALLLFIIRVPLNPMSAALGVFIIAIDGEFTLLIYMQYLRVRAKDAKAGVEEAYRRAYKLTGPAVFASGVTAIAGFLALAVSDINMLRGFALVAVVDLSVALLSTVLLLPVVTIWLERREMGGDAATSTESPAPTDPQPDAPDSPELETIATQ